MQRISGIVLAPGFARGRAWVLSPVLRHVVPRYEVPSAGRDAEVARLEEAVVRSQGDLKALKRRLAEELDNVETGVLDAHILMLEDPTFLRNVRARIRELGENAEQAVSEEIDLMADLFARLNDEYLRERSGDLRDIGQRLVDALTQAGSEPKVVDIPANSILVAHELLPSQAAELDRTRVVGIVTESGGTLSHAAILARSLGVPFVSGFRNALRLIPQGSPLLVDGNRGEVICRPDGAEIREFSRRQALYGRFLAGTRLEEKEPAQTVDGVAIEMWGNVSGVEDADAVIEHHLVGIGLLRTEFAFMDSETAPGLVTQYRTYREIIERVGPSPVTLRCMDLGGDKMPRFLARAVGADECSSARGLRFALEHPAMLLKQLRAFVRCASEGPVRILLPMVSGHDDLLRAIELIDQAVAGESPGVRPPVGAMIETPAALFEIESILELADFISIGTNDLTQYMLAVDRTATDVEGHYSVLYPGVLRAIKSLVEAARIAGRPVSVCGEAAGNPLMAALFVGMGLRELSMSPVRAAAVRHVIRASRLRDLEDLAEEVLAHRHVGKTRLLLDQRIKPLLPGEML